MTRHMTLRELTSLTIDKPDANVYEQMKRRWDSLSKPLDGLGDFEELVCKLGSILRTSCPQILKRAAVVYCADNGIVDENVSQCGKDVTFRVAEALGKNTSSANLCARSANADVFPIDVGIDSDPAPQGVVSRRIARGTKSFLRESAMTEEQTLKAIGVGFEFVRELKERGYELIATGEMGIGNTTTSAAVLCALMGLAPETIVGRGAGLDDVRLVHKIEVVRQGVEKYDLNAYDDPRRRAFEILRTLGGLDIAALVGTFVGGAFYHIPTIVDGLISGTAALTADTIVPGVRDYAVGSHLGRERGVAFVLQELGLKPYLLGNMALGEGTGAVMTIPLIDLALGFYRQASSFEDFEIERYRRFH